jgi:DNA-binding beta-propeller fold protein YncE
MGALAAPSKIYFTQASGTSSLDALKVADIDGTGVTTLADGSDDFAQPKGIAVDTANGYIYVADALAGAAGIVRYNLNGSGRTVVVAPTTGAIYTDVAIGDGKIYFAQASATPDLDAIKSANLDGNGVTTLASGATHFAQPGGIAVDRVNGYIYVADALATGVGIVRYNLDGTGRLVVVAPTASAIYNDIAVGGGKIYFTQASATPELDALKSANLDGSSVSTLASGASHFTQPGGLAVDVSGGYIYVADASATGAGILRYTLTGDSRTVLIPPVAGALYQDVSLEGGDAPPNAPSAPDLASSSDTGTSNVDNITADNTPTFTGTGQAGSTITLISSVQGNVGAATADGSGNWSITSSPLIDGAHTMTATATTGGGTSPASPGLNITIDTVPPSVTVSPPSQSQTAAGSDSVTFTLSYEGADSVFLASGDITLNSTGSASASIGVSGSGVATRTVTLSGITGVGTLGISLAAGAATDTAGNTAGPAGPSATFEVLALDFGDAPTAILSGFASSYPVLLADSGARHRIPSGGATVYLGSAPPDAEADGNPSESATGDDVSGEDDEDGVSLPETFPAGTMASLSVNVAGSGSLNAWIDWNQDGDWDDPGEHVIDDESLSPDGNPHVFQVAVPPDVATGPTFARFRYASAPGLGATGEAVDGEVEDYLATLLANTPPMAGADVLQTGENQPAFVAVLKLLANDSDGDGDPVAVSAVNSSSAAGGTVSLAEEGVLYTPPLDFSGADSFTYLLSDGRGGVAIGTVHVTVRDSDDIGDNPARITPTADGYLIRFAGVPGLLYWVQWADDVSGPWNNLGAPIMANDLGIVETEDTTTPTPDVRFYRMAEIPF